MAILGAIVFVFCLVALMGVAIYKVAFNVYSQIGDELRGKHEDTYN